MSLGVREHRTVGDDSRSATWARRTGTIAVGQSAVKGGQLVLAIVLVHALSPGHWARVAFLLSIHLAATTLGTGNLHHGLVFFLPRTEVSQRRALVAHTASLLAASGAFIAIVLVALAAVIAGPLDVAGLVPWIAVAILLELPTACAPMALLAVGAIRRCAAWDLTATALLLGAVIVPAAAGWGAAGVVRGLAIQAAARLVIFSFVVLPSFAGRVRGVARGTTAAHLRYGFPLGLTLAASVLNRSVDKWYVAAFDSAHVGVHAIAAQEIPLLAVLPYAGGAVTVAALVEAFRHRDLTTASGLWLRQNRDDRRGRVPHLSGRPVDARPARAKVA